MHKGMWIRIAALAVASILLSLPATPLWASVTVPAETKVALKFVNTLDSQHLAEGSQVDFTVVADVIQDREVVIKGDTPVTGTVTKVSKPGMFGTSSQVTISFLSVTAADDKPLKLQDLKISAESFKKNVAIAAGTSVAGAIILGPIGLVGGVFIHGGWVQIPAGSVITSVTQSEARIGI